MFVKKSSVLAGYIFVVGGAVFFLVAATGNQLAFYGIGATFIAIGSSLLNKRK